MAKFRECSHVFRKHRSVVVAASLRWSQHAGAGQHQPVANGRAVLFYSPLTQLASVGGTVAALSAL